MNPILYFVAVAGAGGIYALLHQVLRIPPFAGPDYYWVELLVYAGIIIGIGQSILDGRPHK